MHLWLAILFRHLLGRQQLRVGLLGPANARRARSYDDTDPVSADTRLEFRNAFQETVLLQAEPGQLVVPTLEVLEAFGHLYCFESLDAANPGIEVTTLEIIARQPRLPGPERIAHLRQPDASGRTRRVTGNFQLHI